MVNWYDNPSRHASEQQTDNLSYVKRNSVGHSSVHWEQPRNIICYHFFLNPKTLKNRSKHVFPLIPYREVIHRFDIIVTKTTNDLDWEKQRKRARWSQRHFLKVTVATAWNRKGGEVPCRFPGGHEKGVLRKHCWLSGNHQPTLLPKYPRSCS